MSLTMAVTCRGHGDFCLDLACEIPATGVTAIYGRSGSGKSSGSQQHNRGHRSSFNGSCACGCSFLFVKFLFPNVF